MPLMDDILAYPVPRRAVAMWWFGQNGYIFKSPEETLLGVDLYLTDSCATLERAIDLHRRVPVLLPPDEVRVDVFACTHSHQDHTDPETIRGLAHKDTMRFAGPALSCDAYRREGIESGRITMAWPQGEIEHRDLRLTGTFALPTDDTDLNHMGFVVRFGDGPTVYVTGDTARHELLFSAARHEPDVMISCINGGFNNLSHWEAAELASKVKPRVAIPCHYDLFPDNGADPQQFRAALALQVPEVRYQQLVHGEPFVFARE